MYAIQQDSNDMNTQIYPMLGADSRFWLANSL